jgi:hypothetical protein
LFAPAPDLLAIPALLLAVDQMDPKASLPELGPVVDVDGLPSDAAVVEEPNEDDCFWPILEKLWFGEMVLERGDLADVLVGLLMVDWTEV